jgi:hypothetical protein
MYCIEWLYRRNGPFQTGLWSGLAKWNVLDKVIAKVQFDAESLDLSSLLVDNIGCPTSDVAERAIRETAPHTRGVNKAGQLSEGWLQ